MVINQTVIELISRLTKPRVILTQVITRTKEENEKEESNAYVSNTLLSEVLSKLDT